MKRLSFMLFYPTAILLVLSGIGCKDSTTWLMEVAPVIIGWPVLLWIDFKFGVSRLLIAIVFLHGLILMLGGHYTYAEVPLGDWMREWFGWQRNHYDRIGHLAQGFFPTVLWREVYVRNSSLKGGFWLEFSVVTACMAFSLFYELIEWWAAVAMGAGADAFLGSQGDVWDTQWDMFLCTVGAIVACGFFSKRHLRELAVTKRQH